MRRALAALVLSASLAAGAAREGRPTSDRADQRADAGMPSEDEPVGASLELLENLELLERLDRRVGCQGVGQIAVDPDPHAMNVI